MRCLMQVLGMGAMGDKVDSRMHSKPGPVAVFAVRAEVHIHVRQGVVSRVHMAARCVALQLYRACGSYVHKSNTGGRHEVSE